MPTVVICFKIRIFAQRQTSKCMPWMITLWLWFALKFVSLHKDKHQANGLQHWHVVVICFKIRIFAQRQTSFKKELIDSLTLWFALKFVSLHKDKHRFTSKCVQKGVLWFALKFVSLHKDKHRKWPPRHELDSCDLL